MTLDDSQNRWEGADEDTKQLASPSTSSSPPQHTLRVLEGDHTDRLVSLEAGESVAGRGGACQVPLADAGVSRAHAAFSVSGDEVLLSDLGSRNGTYVNGTLITAKVRLQPGDVLTLGSVRLRYAIESRDHAWPANAFYDVAVRDPLTRVYNQRFFEDRLPAEVAYAERHAAPLSLLLFDVDALDALIQTHGQAAGSAALKAVARTLTRGVRAEDLVARREGEGFVVMARGAELEGALALAERLRRQVEATPVPFANLELRVTVSAGAAAVSRQVTSVRQLLAAADFALLEAKKQGRNRVAGSTGANDIARTIEIAVLRDEPPLPPSSAVPGLARPPR